MIEAIRLEIRAMMVGNRFSYKDLAGQLRIKYGIIQAESTLRTKINSGKMSAQLLEFILLILDPDFTQRHRIGERYALLRPKLKCPKCSDAMSTVLFEEVELDRCHNSECGAVFFDSGELSELLLHKVNPNDIDPHKVNPNKNAIRDYPCPKCGGQMDPVSENGIEYEVCSSCKGSLLDAGEYRQIQDLLSEESEKEKIKLAPSFKR